VAAIVVIAVRRSRPAWTLAALALAYSVGLFAAQVMTLGCTANRYFVAPGLLLITAIAALLRPRPDATDATDVDTTRPGRLATATVVFLTLAAVVCVANLRNDSYRSVGPAWSDVVRKARAECAEGGRERVTMITSVPSPEAWTLTVKCSVLTR
jgi:hypothetical protein